MTRLPSALVRKNDPLSPLGLFAAAVAFLLPVAFSPLVRAHFWAPKAALVLLVAGVGVPLLVRHAVDGTRGARPAAAFLLVSAVATAFSPEPTAALVGLFGWGTGWLFIAALTGAWAIGTSLDERERGILVGALLTGFAVNAAVAVLQVVFDLGRFGVPLRDDRAPGLLGNSVHLGALALAAFALVAARFRPRPTDVGLVVAAAVALQLSGSRFPLVGLALVTVTAAVRLGLRRTAPLVLALALGLATAPLLSDAEDTAGTGSERLAQEPGGAGVRARLLTWSSARHAVADRPVLGAGPGRFRAATSRYRTFALARAEGPDRLFTDAHNLVVEYVTTTGLLGLATLAIWVAVATRAATGPLRWFALALLAMHLVQPQSVGTTPLAFLALGAAGPRGPCRARAVALPGLAVAAAAAVAAGALLLGTFRLEQARLDFDLADAKTAQRVIGFWPEPWQIAARIHVVAPGGERRAGYEQAIRSLSQAVRRDPTDPQRWSDLASAEASLLQRFADARRHYRVALRYNPWSFRALAGAAQASLALDQPEQAVAPAQRAARFPGRLSGDRLLARARAAAAER